MKKFFNARIILSAFMVINHPLDFASKDYEKEIKKMLPAPYEVGKEYFKSPSELDEYILSRQGKKKEVKKYLSDYKPLILSASNIFKVPFSFQSCLIYRESHFNHKAKSHVGALGMAQFTKDTYEFLGKALFVGRDHLGVSSLGENVYFQERAIPTGLSKSKYNLEIYKKMHLLWEYYLSSNDLNPVDLRATSHKKVLLDPLYSIGLSSMYLFYLRHRLRHKLGEKAEGEDLIDHPELLLSVAGAYNQGARRLLRVASRDKGLNFSKWINYQSKISETKDYIHSIRNCMKSERKLKTKDKGFALVVKKKGSNL